MTPIFLLGGGALLLFLLAKSSPDTEKVPFIEAVILDGNEGDEYEMVQSAIVSQTSPFDRDSVVIYYNDWKENIDEQVQSDINTNAKEAGIKAVAHVYGPSDNTPYLRHYSGGDLVTQLAPPDVRSWADVVNWLDDLSAAKVGRKVIAYAGKGNRKVIAAAGKSNRKVIAAAGKGSADHMAGMFADRNRPRVQIRK